MNRVIVDPVTRDKLLNTHQKLELCDDSGHVFGYFVPLEDQSPHTGKEPLISEEEIKRRLQQGGGRRLEEILSSLEPPHPLPGRCRGMLTVLSEDDEHLKDWAEYMP
jgi:hypothetical protein